MIASLLYFIYVGAFCLGWILNRNGTSVEFHERDVPMRTLLEVLELNLSIVNYHDKIMFV